MWNLIQEPGPCSTAEPPLGGGRGASVAALRAPEPTEESVSSDLQTMSVTVNTRSWSSTLTFIEKYRRYSERGKGTRWICKYTWGRGEVSSHWEETSTAEPLVHSQLSKPPGHFPSRTEAETGLCSGLLCHKRGSGRKNRWSHLGFLKGSSSSSDRQGGENTHLHPESERKTRRFGPFEEIINQKKRKKRKNQHPVKVSDEAMRKILVLFTRLCRFI